MIELIMDREYVLEKLKKKKELDPDCIGFGVEAHNYELNSPISDKKLRELEKKFKISLPEEYRSFLLNVGNGGAGPSYGLYSIEGALTGICPTYNRYPSGKAGIEITKDFIRPDQVKEGEYPDDYGMLILCQHGCALDDFLILNGSERAFVWEYVEWVGHHVPLLKKMPDISTNNLPEPVRLAAAERWVTDLLKATNEEKMTFTDWYLNWLDKPPHILPSAKKRHKASIWKKYFKFLQ